MVKVFEFDRKDTKKMKRVGLYVRVSTQEQKNHGLSVDSQIVALKEYAQENNYEVYDVYNDAGISARKTYKKRPELLRLVQDCKDNKIDLILFTKLDRYFRSVGDYYEVQKELDSCNVPWRAIWEDYETETSNGIFKVNIMLSVAQSEADRTSERIKAVNDYRRAAGQYVGGKSPLGYKIQKSQLIIDEEQREAVKDFFEDYLTNLSVTHAMRVLRQYGINNCRDSVLKTLKNPTYYGQTAQGYECEPYITKEQYDIIQNSFANRTVSKNKNRVYLFAGGIFKCACCGHYMIGSTRTLQSGKNKREYKFYRCASARDWVCTQKASISEMIVEKHLLDNLEKELSRPSISATISDEEIKSIDKEIAKLKKQLSRVGDRYEMGDISKNEYIEKRDSIKRTISELEQTARPKTKSLPVDWRIIYDSLDDSHKKAFWYQTLSLIEFDKSSDEPISFVF